MFEPIGKKLMRLSSICLFVFLALTLGAGIYTWVQLSRLRTPFFLCLLIFLGIAAAGGFLALVSSMLVYSRGRIAEDLRQLRQGMTGDMAPEPAADRFTQAGYTPDAPRRAGRQRRSQSGRENAARRETAPAEQEQKQTQAAPWPASAMPQADMIGRSGWIQADAIYIQCPCCGSRMTPEFALTHHGCPQCKTPYQP